MATPPAASAAAQTAGRRAGRMRGRMRRRVAFIILGLTVCIECAAGGGRRRADEGEGSDPSRASQLRRVSELEGRGSESSRRDVRISAVEELAVGDFSGEEGHSACSNCGRRLLNYQNRRPWIHSHRLRKRHDICWARSEKHLYNPSVAGIKSSPALVEKMAAYIHRYRKCWQGTSDWAYVVGLSQGETAANISRLAGCKYAMVDLSDGLGNRLLSFVSIFIWALLTDRVLLVSNTLLEATLCDLPAPESSWWAPSWQQSPPDVPYAHLLKLDNVTKLEPSKEGAIHVAWVEVSHRHEYSDGPAFFCEETQKALQEHVKTVTIQSNQFFAAGLWFVPSMADELLRLFPDRMLFRHVARYILNPNNIIWDRITRMFRNDYGDAQERVGMQIRTRLEDDTGVPPVVLDCAVNVSRVLPPPSLSGMWARELDQANQRNSKVVAAYLKHNEPKMAAVFIASLNGSHANYLRQVYREGPSPDGTYVVVRTETADSSQDDSIEQAQRAYAEIWLLSLSDKLLVSAASTFGYVAAGLGGHYTYMLDIQNWNAGRFYAQNRASCFKLVGPDPCYHYPPHILQCRKPLTLRESFFSKFEPLATHPFVQKCPDMAQGIVIVPEDEGRGIGPGP